MSSVFLGCKTDGSHPFVDEHCILSRAEVVVGMDATGECKIIDAAPPRRSSQASRLALVSAVISN